jgi:outer membrane protein assembly factor BamB
MLFLLAAPGLLAESPWPQFRGPNGSGVAPDAHPPVFFGPASNVLWTISLPSGYSSPCVWGERIFLTGYDGEKLETLCVARRDGKILWRRTAPARQIEAFNKREGNPAAGTPATDGARVYVYFGSCGLLCYDHNGKEQWQLPLPVAKTVGDFGSGTSPIVADGLVILNRDQATNSALLAVNARTGRIAWQSDRPDFFSSWSTPVIWAQSAKEVVLPGFLRLKSYDLKTGVERWTVRGLAAAVCTSPVIGDGLLYCATWSTGGSGGEEASFPPFEMLLLGDKDGDGKISLSEAKAAKMGDFFNAYDSNKDGFIERQEWDGLRNIALQGKNSLLAIRSGGRGDITATHVAWTVTKGLPYVPSPLFYQGRIYLVKDGGMVSCFEAKTGKELFVQERLGAPGSYYASPVAADGKIFFASLKGVITVLEAGDTLKVLASNEFGERLGSTPALVGNQMFVRTDQHLHAFGASVTKR